MNCFIRFERSRVRKEATILILSDKVVYITKDAKEEEKLYSRSYVEKINDLNGLIIRSLEKDSLLYQTYNKINANCLSYIAFYLDSINEFVKEKELTEIVIESAVPKQWYFPISHFSGDVSHKVSYDFKFLSPLIVKGVENCNINYEQKHVILVRPYGIFIIKFLLSIFYKTLAVLAELKGKKALENKVFVVRNSKGKSHFERLLDDAISSNQITVIPSFNIKESIVSILRYGSLANCFVNPFKRVKVKVNELHITSKLRISSEFILKMYKLEEYDKLQVRQFFKEKRFSEVFSLDLLNELGFFIQHPDVKSTFVQSYALTTERNLYLPDYVKMILSDEKLKEKLISHYLVDNVWVVNRKIKPFIPKKKISRIVVITQPNVKFELFFFPLHELKKLCKTLDIELWIKCHPRDTKSYEDFHKIDNDQLFNAEKAQTTIFLGLNSFLLYELFENGFGFLHCDKINTAELSYIESTNYVASLDEVKELILKPDEYNKRQEDFYNGQR